MNVTSTVNDDDDENEFQQYLRGVVGSDEPRQNISINNIEQKLFNLAFEPRLHSMENVLEYYEKKKNEEPELHNVAQIVLAVPTAQVSVERSFSALGIILSASRTQLSSKSIDDILTVRQNAEYLKKIDPNL